MRTRMKTRGPWTVGGKEQALRLARGISALLPDGWLCRVWEVHPDRGAVRFRVEVEGPGGAAEPGAGVSRVVAVFAAGSEV